MIDLPENSTFPFNDVCQNASGGSPGPWETAAAMAALHEQMCVVADLVRHDRGRCSTYRRAAGPLCMRDVPRPRARRSTAGPMSRSDIVVAIVVFVVLIALCAVVAPRLGEIMVGWGL